MKRTIVAITALVLGSTSAYAEVVAPTNVMFEDGAVSKSLTGTPGDAAAGAKAFSNRKQGNCLACHANTDMADQPFHGEVGPSLDGVATRWTEAELRGIVANSKKTFEGTIMPAFYITEGYNRPLEKFEGKSVLTAQQVEDIVAYLMTLKSE